MRPILLLLLLPGVPLFARSSLRWIRVGKEDLLVFRRRRSERNGERSFGRWYYEEVGLVVEAWWRWII